MDRGIRKGVLQLALSDPTETKNAAVRGIVSVGGQSVEAWVKVVPPRELLVECLCALLVRELGLDGPEPLIVLVPAPLRPDGQSAVAFGSVAASFGALRPWLVQIGQPAVERLLRAWPGLAAAACFDEWIGNNDRQAGNILFDGADGFWLIDHGQGVPDGVDPSAVIPNILFGVLVSGLSELGLVGARPHALGHAEHYRDHDLEPVSQSLLSGLGDFVSHASVVDWLSLRQAQLVRLVHARFPAAQSGFIYGAGDHER